MCTTTTTTTTNMSMSKPMVSKPMVSKPIPPTVEEYMERVETVLARHRKMGITTPSIGGFRDEIEHTLSTVPWIMSYRSTIIYKYVTGADLGNYSDDIINQYLYNYLMGYACYDPHCQTT
jgi:hypothetical protein